MNNLIKMSDNTYQNDEYVFFWGSYLSNWYKCKFDNGIYSFSSSEQALMWYKAMVFEDVESASKILKTNDPKKQKALGRTVVGYDDTIWSKYRYEIMVEILRWKFDHNKELLDKLLATGDKTIVEAAPNDKIWGIGMSVEFDDILDESKWRGQNLLGKALMEVRLRLRK